MRISIRIEKVVSLIKIKILNINVVLLNTNGLLLLMLCELLLIESYYLDLNSYLNNMLITNIIIKSGKSESYV